MPDVFVPRDTTVFSGYYTRLQGLNLIREYALNFYQGHKADLDDLRF
jgi:carboxyl-terminal processing protease